MRTFYDTPLKDSRILVYDLEQFILSELMDVNDSYVNKALGRQTLSHQDLFKKSWCGVRNIWNLEINTNVFDEDIRDLENFSVGNFNNPYLVALFCKTLELLDFKNQAQVLRYGLIPEGSYGD